MIKTLATHKKELEKELRERVQAFFEANNDAPESVSIEMKLNKSDLDNGSSAIHILVKDSEAETTLVSM